MRESYFLSATRSGTYVFGRLAFCFMFFAMASIWRCARMACPIVQRSLGACSDQLRSVMTLWSDQVVRFLTLARWPRSTGSNIFRKCDEDKNFSREMQGNGDIESNADRHLLANSKEQKKTNDLDHADCTAEAYSTHTWFRKPGRLSTCSRGGRTSAMPAIYSISMCFFPHLVSQKGSLQDKWFENRPVLEYWYRQKCGRLSPFSCYYALWWWFRTPTPYVRWYRWPYWYHMLCTTMIVDWTDV